MCACSTSSVTRVKDWGGEQEKTAKRRGRGPALPWRSTLLLPQRCNCWWRRWSRRIPSRNFRLTARDRVSERSFGGLEQNRILDHWTKPGCLGLLSPASRLPRRPCFPPGSSAPCPERTAKQPKQPVTNTFFSSGKGPDQSERAHFLHVADPLGEALEGHGVCDVVDKDDALQTEPC